MTGNTTEDKKELERLAIEHVEKIESSEKEMDVPTSKF